MSNAIPAINSEAELRSAIMLLESKQAEEKKLLKEEIHATFESMKPINILKNTLKDAVASEELKGHALNSSLGFAAGYISKKVFEGATHSPVRKLLGSLVMMGVSKLIAKNPEALGSLKNTVLNFFSKKSEKETVELQEEVEQEA